MLLTGIVMNLKNAKMDKSKSKKVDVLLFKSLRGYGVPGDKVSVAPGFARNKLIPTGYADYATVANLKKLEEMRAELATKDAEYIKTAKEIQANLHGVALEFFCKVRENQNIYGSIQSRDIMEALKEKGFKIEKSQIILAHPLKVLGESDVKIELYGDVEATVHVVLKSSADKVNE